MSQNYHAPIAFAAPANSAVLEAPLGQLDQAITDLDTRIDTLEGLPLGSAGFTQLALVAANTLTIASGAVTASRSRHVIAAESGTTDELEMIHGYDSVLDDLLIIQADTGDTITVKHNTGATAASRISFADGADRVITGTQTLWLVYDHANSRWVENSQSGAINRNTEWDSTDVKLRELTLPYGSFLDLGSNAIRFDVQPTWMRRLWWGEKAAAATYASVGMAAGTNAGAGAVTEDNDATTTAVSQAIAAAGGTFGGRRSTTFDLVRRNHNPVFEAVIRTGAVITNIRFWIGLFSANVTNADIIAAGTEAIAIRYSTVVPDAGWVGVTNDGATQSVTSSAIAAIAAATWYKLRIRVDSTNGVAYFSVNDSAELSLSANLPAAATELGAVVVAITTTASAKVMVISRYGCTYD